jgi:FkbM family methyltransferase
VNDRFKRAIQAMARRGGYEIRRLNPTHDEVRRANLLARLGVNVVLDVGANAGQYAQRLRGVGYTGRIVSFEPLSAAFAELSRLTERDPLWESRRLALGRSEGSAEINVSALSQCSSLLKMKEPHLTSFPTIATETVPLTRLESIWNEIVRRDDRTFFKLDVQGFEIEVLGGAEAVLAGVVGVQAELSLVSRYEGSPSYSDVIAYLESHGFRLADIEPVVEDFEIGELRVVDGIFIRR